MTTPIAHEPGAGEGADFGAVRFSIKADSSHTNGAYSLVEASGGVFATPHIHHTREEAFYVVDGRITFLAGEQTVEGTAGSFVLVPRGTMHGFRSDGVAKLVIIHSPGGFERFFREVAAAIREDRFTTEFRDRLAEQLELTYYDEVTF